MEVQRLNGDIYDTRKIFPLHSSLLVTLPKKYTERNFIEKGTEMLVVGKSRIFVIVPLHDYTISPYLREKIEKFFQEEKF